MSRTRSSHDAALCIFIVLALALAAGIANAGSRTRDLTWCDPALSSHPLSTIAILPVVSLTGDERAERWVEMGWTIYYEQAKTNWIPSVLVRAAVPGPELAEVRDQVWRQGAPSSGAAVGVARALAVDAVLSVRVDRWEVVDGGRAQVELTAVLTAADGTRLWSVSGLAGHGRMPGSRDRNFNQELTWIRPAKLEPGPSQDPRGMALCMLFARWTAALPEPIAPEAGVPPAQLAGAPN